MRSRASTVVSCSSIPGRKSSLVSGCPVMRWVGVAARPRGLIVDGSCRSAGAVVSGGGDGVGGPAGRFVEAGRGAGGVRELGGRGDRDAITANDAIEGIDGRELFLDTGQEVLLGVGLLGDEVEVVGGPPAGDHRVEQLPVLVAGDDAVHDVGRVALSGMDRGGVAELNVLTDVRRRQRSEEHTSELQSLMRYS